MTALDMLSGRGLVHWDDGLYRVDEHAVDVIEYYANSIAYWRESSDPAVEAS